MQGLGVHGLCEIERLVQILADYAGDLIVRNLARVAITAFSSAFRQAIVLCNSR